MAEVWEVTEMEAKCHSCYATVAGEIKAKVVVQCDVRLTATVTPTPEKDRRAIYEAAAAARWRWMREQGCNASLLGALSNATPERFDEVADASMRHLVSDACNA